MTHLDFFIDIEQIGVNPIACQMREAEFGHKARARPGQYRTACGARVGEQAHGFKRLVGGNAATDDQQDPFAFKNGHSSTPVMRTLS